MSVVDEKAVVCPPDTIVSVGQTVECIGLLHVEYKILSAVYQGASANYCWVRGPLPMLYYGSVTADTRAEVWLREVVHLVANLESALPPFHMR